MYCLLVWHICSVSDCKKVEKIQERSLCYDTYCNLLQRAPKSTLYLSCLRILAIEIFKVLNDMSPLYMNSLFIKKCITHELRDFIPFIQPKFNTITYGHNTITYQGSKIWNNLSNNIKMSNGLSSFKKSIQKWSGPECHCRYCLQCTLACIYHCLNHHFFSFIIILVKSYF